MSPRPYNPPRLALIAGTRLGHYEIVATLGSGGMGEVYRAHDTKLGRGVAVKVLPEAVANDPERIARLQREAQSLAALTHPSIATLYGMEEASNRHFLVMELVEGETLAARLARGPLPLAYALTTAMQIADALAAAHRAGIVHRDLKPGNVMITKGGVKLLDFGIAKASDPAVIGQSASLHPTTAPGITEPGAILGTFQYMAPEQVHGQNADARTDLFAFGCVLFEMLTGRKAFEGPTPAAVVAATIHDEPPPISTLQPAAPRALDRVVAKCLAKDRDDRWQSAGDLRDTLRWIGEADAIQPEVAAHHSRTSRIGGARFSLVTLAAILVALIATAVAILSFLRPGAADRRVTRTVVTLPAGTALSLGQSSPAIAISPDGRHIAYVAAHAGTLQLHLRSLDQLDPRVIDGVRATRIDMPFFSADSQWLGFTTPEGLWKVSTSGGVPVRISGLAFARGASWGGGDIVLTVGGNALARMSAEGGEPAVLTTPNVEQHEKGHRLAHILPGGQTALFTLAMSNIHLFDDAPVGVVSLETGAYRTVLNGGSNPQYSPSGHLVFARAGTLFAVPFDLGALRVTGSPVAVVHGVTTSPNTGHAEFSLARDGSLLYAPGGAWGQDRRVVWVHRDGRVEPLLENQGGWFEPRISPDGARLAVSGDEANSNIWVFDLVRGDGGRLTNDGDNASPIWAPDSRHVAFGRNPMGSGQGDTFIQVADGSQPADRLTTNGLGGGLGPNSWLPTSFSPDGKIVAMQTRRPQTGWDTYLLEPAGGQPPTPFMDSQHDEWHAVISPDGRWVAYQSNVPGRPEIYVRPFRGSTRSWRMSTEGGTLPVWNPKGGELFFRNEDKMMAVDVGGSDTIARGKPRVLFERRVWNFNPMHRNFDSSPDGQRFAVIDDSHAMPPPTQLILVQHWAEELKRLVPAK